MTKTKHPSNRYERRLLDKKKYEATAGRKRNTKVYQAAKEEEDDLSRSGRDYLTDQCDVTG